jgi:hypothetical protein
MSLGTFMKQLFKKPATPDLSKTQDQEDYVLAAHNAAALLQKEIDVNRVEQELLKQRIKMMKQFLNDLPESDPQHFMILTQTDMDRIELDELLRRETNLVDQLNKIGGNHGH